MKDHIQIVFIVYIIVGIRLMLWRLGFIVCEELFGFQYMLHISLHFPFNDGKLELN